MGLRGGGGCGRVGRGSVLCSACGTFGSSQEGCLDLFDEQSGTRAQPQVRQRRQQLFGLIKSRKWRVRQGEYRRRVACQGELCGREVPDRGQCGTRLESGRCDLAARGLVADLEAHHAGRLSGRNHDRRWCGCRMSNLKRLTILLHPLKDDLALAQACGLVRATAHLPWHPLQRGSGNVCGGCCGGRNACSSRRCGSTAVGQSSATQRFLHRSALSPLLLDAL
mmetsp:Transcript_91555/g.296408  ORF Transcript_91555/g.296408 Transcript_91555/m.296408 type:complete len:223 (-) Transcript_91555:1475-2143(-)